MRLSSLTSLALQLNGASSSGRHVVAVHDVKERLADGTIFLWLEQFLGADLDLSLMSSNEKSELAAEWQDFALAIDEERKLGVDRRGGLLLLVAYLLEGLQRRVSDLGWRRAQPTTLSGRPKS